MHSIPIREFQQNASEYLDKLPITLTRYDKPIAQVVPISQGGVYTQGREVQKIEEDKQEGEVVFIHPRSLEALRKVKSTGYCEANKGHAFERGVIRDVFKIEVLSSEDTVVFDKMACRKCIDWFGGQIVSYGGRIE